MDKIRVNFVCLGNICRSPMAEGLFIHKIKEEGLEKYFEVDSSGTGGWHVGEPADPRMREVAKQHGVHLPSRARKFIAQDHEDFDYILAMDGNNYGDILDLRKGTKKEKAEVFKMRDFDKDHVGKDVPDPYYGGKEGFQKVYEMLARSTAELLAHIRKERGI
ncbi:MAG: low molecular weight protein-tyrosine-phosphatase [Bacteroidota bacterium]